MQDKHRDSGRAWKVGLALMVGLFIAATAASLVLASRRVSRVVDRDYYQHGLHYGEKVLTVEKR